MANFDDFYDAGSDYLYRMGDPGVSREEAIRRAKADLTGRTREENIRIAQERGTFDLLREEFGANNFDPFSGDTRASMDARGNIARSYPGGGVPKILDEDGMPTMFDDTPEGRAAYNEWRRRNRLSAVNAPRPGETIIPGLLARPGPAPAAPASYLDAALQRTPTADALAQDPGRALGISSKPAGARPVGSPVARADAPFPSAPVKPTPYTGPSADVLRGQSTTYDDQKSAAAQRNARTDFNTEKNRREQDFRSRGVLFYTDANGMLQPQVDPETGRVLYRETELEPKKDEKTGIWYLRRRNSLGDIINSPAKLKPSADPADPMLYYDLGEGRTEVAGHTDDILARYATEKAAMSNPALAEWRKVALKARADRTKTAREEAIRPLAEAKDASSASVAAGKIRYDELRQQAEALGSQIAEIDNNPAAQARSGGTWFTKGELTDEARRLQSQRAQLQTKLDALQSEATRASADLDKSETMDGRAKADLDLAKLQGKGETIQDAIDARREYLRSAGRDEAADPYLAKLVDQATKLGEFSSQAAQARAEDERRQRALEEGAKAAAREAAEKGMKAVRAETHGRDIVANPVTAQEREEIVAAAKALKTARETLNLEDPQAVEAHNAQVAENNKRMDQLNATAIFQNVLAEEAAKKAQRVDAVDRNARRLVEAMEEDAKAAAAPRGRGIAPSATAKADEFLSKFTKEEDRAAVRAAAEAIRTDRAAAEAAWQTGNGYRLDYKGQLQINPTSLLPDWERERVNREAAQSTTVLDRKTGKPVVTRAATVPAPTAREALNGAVAEGLIPQEVADQFAANLNDQQRQLEAAAIARTVTNRDFMAWYEANVAPKLSERIKRDASGKIIPTQSIQDAAKQWLAESKSENGINDFVQRSYDAMLGTLPIFPVLAVAGRVTGNERLENYANDTLSFIENRGDVRRDEKFASALASGVGSVAGFVATGGITTAAARNAAARSVVGLRAIGAPTLAKAAAPAIKNAVTFITSGAQSAASTMRQLDKAGVAKEDQWLPILISGGVTGLTETTPYLRTLDRYLDALDGKVKGEFGRRLTNYLTTSVKEAAQESTQQIADNAVALGYDPTVDGEISRLFDGLGEAALVGGILGAAGTAIPNEVRNAVVGIRNVLRQNEAANAAREQVAAVSSAREGMAPSLKAIESGDFDGIARRWNFNHASEHGDLEITPELASAAAELLPEAANVREASREAVTAFSAMEEAKARRDANAERDALARLAMAETQAAEREARRLATYTAALYTQPELDAIPDDAPEIDAKTGQPVPQALAEVSRTRDAATALAKIALGAKPEELTTQQTAAVKNLAQELGVPAITPVNGVPIITDVARQWLAEQSPTAASVLLPEAEVRKEAAAAAPATKATTTTSQQGAQARQPVSYAGQEGSIPSPATTSAPAATASAPNTTPDNRGTETPPPAGAEPVIPSATVTFTDEDGNQRTGPIPPDAETSDGKPVRNLTTARQWIAENFNGRVADVQFTPAPSGSPKTNVEAPSAPAAEVAQAPVSPTATSTAEATSVLDVPVENLITYGWSDVAKANYGKTEKQLEYARAEAEKNAQSKNKNYANAARETLAAIDLTKQLNSLTEEQFWSLVDSTNDKDFTSSGKITAKDLFIQIFAEKKDAARFYKSRERAAAAFPDVSTAGTIPTNALISPANENQNQEEARQGQEGLLTPPVAPEGASTTPPPAAVSPVTQAEAQPKGVPISTASEGASVDGGQTAEAAPSSPPVSEPSPSGPSASASGVEASTPEIDATVSDISPTIEAVASVLRQVDPVDPTGQERNWPATPDSWAGKVADAIDAKDADTLRSMVGHGRGLNDSTKTAVFSVLGIPKPKTKAGIEAAIDEWAGVTPAERARRDAQAGVERNVETARQNLQNAEADLAAANVVVDMGDGSTQPAREYVENLISSGYNKLEKIKGRYVLTNRVAGKSMRMSTPDMMGYARARIAVIDAEQAQKIAQNEQIAENQGEAAPTVTPSADAPPAQLAPSAAQPADPASSDLPEPVVFRGKNTPARFVSEVFRAANLAKDKKAQPAVLDFTRRLHKANPQAFADMEVRAYSEEEWSRDPGTSAYTPDSSLAYNPETNTLYLRRERVKDLPTLVSGIVHEAGHFAERYALDSQTIADAWNALSDEQIVAAAQDYNPSDTRDAAEIRADKRARSEWLAQQFARVVTGRADTVPQSIRGKLMVFFKAMKAWATKYLGGDAAASAALDREILRVMQFDEEANPVEPDVQPDAPVSIGTNSEGVEVFQDARGIRSVLVDGIRREEPVGIAPFRDPNNSRVITWGPVGRSAEQRAGTEFETVEEAQAQVPAPKPTISAPSATAQNEQEIVELENRIEIAKQNLENKREYRINARRQWDRYRVENPQSSDRNSETYLRDIKFTEREESQAKSELDQLLGRQRDLISSTKPAPAPAVTTQPAGEGATATTITPAAPAPASAAKPSKFKVSDDLRAGLDELLGTPAEPAPVFNRKFGQKITVANNVIGMIVRDNPDINSRQRLAEFIAEVEPRLKPFSESLFSVLSGAVDTVNEGPMDWNAIYAQLDAQAASEQAPAQDERTSQTPDPQRGGSNQGAARADRPQLPVGMESEQPGPGSQNAGRGDATPAPQGGGVAGQPNTGSGPAGQDDASGGPRNLRDLRGTESAPVTPEAHAWQNYRITPADRLGEGGLVQKHRDNIAAIRTLKQIEASDRLATAAEKAILVRYVGWGGLKSRFNPDSKDYSQELRDLLTEEEYAAARRSVQDAHYTSPTVIQRGIYAAMERFGFRGGKMVEGGVGIGNFIGFLPDSMVGASSYVGIERDSLTARIASRLYPQAKIHEMGFQDADLQRDQFDGSVGNPPFGEQRLTDKRFKEEAKHSIHNYFIAKQLALLRPGGVAGYVVSHYFLDAKDPSARQHIAQSAQFLGAIRLPNTAFKQNANTEVTTDIVFFRKLAPGEQANTDWVNTGTLPEPGTGKPMTVSSWFVTRPEMMLGKLTLQGSMYAGRDELTLEPTGKDQDLGADLDAAVAQLPANVYRQAEPEVSKRLTDSSPRQDAPSADTSIPAEVRVGAYYVTKDGKVMRRSPDVNMERQSQPLPEDTPALTLERIKGLIGVRDAMNALVRAEFSEDTPETELARLRRNLNEVYDAFTKSYGLLNSLSNRRAFYDDPEAMRLLGLETKYDAGVSSAVAKKTGGEARKPNAEKADIFRQRVNVPYREVTKVATAKEALAVAMNQRGEVDLPYMAELSGLPEAQIITDLAGLMFRNPLGGYETREQYLSGNVRAKLTQAEAAQQREGDQWQANVEALRAVIPADIAPLDIGVPIGAGWVPADVYSRFVADLTRQAPDAIVYRVADGGWLFNHPSSTEESRTRWGVSKDERTVDFETLFRNLLNARPTIVYDKTDDDKQVVNEEFTTLAAAKSDEIKARFAEWIWEDADRRERLARIYNDQFNNYVDPHYDGSHLTLPGANPAIQLRAHQKNVIWRTITERRALYDHVVGAGKTFAGIGAFMEMRRMGRVRKPLFVVPNHLTKQWADEFTKLYPSSNVLFTSPKDFSKENRQKLFAKVLTGEYDAIIIGHSQFKKIGVSPEIERGLLNEMRDEITETIEAMKKAEGKRNSRAVSQAEKTREKIEEKLKKLADGGERDSVATFEELGIDGLFLDEAHEFKNLFYTTQMQRVAGLGDHAGSGKAFDLYLKTRYMHRRFGGKAPLVFATGTPISNSLVEMFTVQRYLQPDVLADMGLKTLDAWVKVFGDVQQVYEVDPTGTGYRMATRLAQFRNVGEISSIYRTVADVITMSDLVAQAEAEGGRFPVPKVKGGRAQNVVVDRTRDQEAFFGIATQKINDDGSPAFNADGSPVMQYPPGSILYRLENMPDDPKIDNMLKLTSDARKAGLDMRLVDPNYRDHPGSKVNKAVASIVDTYKRWNADKGTQLVFCDLSTPLSAKRKARAKKAEAASQFYFTITDGVITPEDDAKPVKIPGAPEGLEFFLARSPRTGKWRVYERSSGRALPGSESTQSAAVTAAGMWIDRLGAETVRQQISAAQLPAEQIAEARGAWLAAKEAQSAEQETAGQVDEDGNAIDAAAAEVNSDEEAALADTSDFSVYDDMKAKLVAAGIPEKEIAFIHDYDTPQAKQKLFDQMNRGEMRVLFGSTPKLGAGTNVQKRLVALHHLDAPWRPSDLEQREGRIIRQGNELYKRDPEGFEVEVARYATKQTYDTRMWQLLEHKSRGIEGFRKADRTTRTVDNVDGEAANAADMKAAASGDPLIQREIELRNDLGKLDLLKRAWSSQRFELQGRVRFLSEADARRDAAVAAAQALIDIRQPVPENPWFMTKADGTRHEGKKGVGEMLAAVAKKVTEGGSDNSFGNYRGFEFRVIVGNGGSAGTATQIDARPIGSKSPWAEATTFYSKYDTISDTGTVQRLDNYLASFEEKIEIAQKQHASQLQTLAQLNQELARPFAKEAELQRLRDEHAQVKQQLLAGKSRPAQQQQGEQPLGTPAEPELDPRAPVSFTYRNAAPGDLNAVRENDVRRIQNELGIAIRPKILAGIAQESGLLDNLDSAVPGSGEIQPGQADARGLENARAQLELVFRKRILFAEFPQGMSRTQAFTHPGLANVIVVNTQASEPFMALVLHELGHNIDRQAPELYEGFAKVVLATNPVPESYMQEKLPDYKGERAAVTREWVNDMLAERAGEPEFWQTLAKVAAEMDAKEGKTANSTALRQFAGKAIDYFGTLIQRIKNVFLRSEVSGAMVAEVGMVRRAAAAMIADYVRNMPTEGYAEAQTLTPEDSDVQRSTEGADSRRLFNDLLQDLPDRARDIVRSRMRGESFESIGARYGFDARRAESLFKSADGLTRARLRKAMGEGGGGDFGRWFAGSVVTNTDGSPLRVYRGEWGDPATKSFSATRLGLPTFTDAKTIAEVYASDGDAGRVIPAYLAIKTPLRFGMEDGVVTKAEMARIAKDLRLTKPELNDLVSLGDWVVDGQPESFQTLAEIPDGAYVEAPTLADTAIIQQKARAAGFDGIIIRGIFTSDAEPSGSFDGVTAIEYRPLSADQVRPAMGESGGGDATGGTPARLSPTPGTGGGQTLGTPAERLSPETPVRIVNARPAPSLRGKDAEAWGRQNLLNRDFIKDGNTYRINQRGLEKMVRDATKPLPRVQVAAIYSLPELFDASIHVDARPSDRSDPEVMAIHSFVAPLRWEGQVYRVRFLAKEQKPFARPDKLHSYRVDEIQVETENPPVTTSAPSSAEPADTIPLRLLAPSVNLGTPLGTPAEPTPADDAAIREHLDALRMQSGLDAAKLERDYQKALAEAPGRKTIGDPRLANPGRSDETRSVVNSVDEQRRNTMERESHDLWQAEAEKQIAANFPAVVRDLLERVRGGLDIAANPVAVKAAQLAVERLSREAVQTGDAQKLRDAQTLAYAYRVQGSEQARALAARRDPFKTPRQRMAEFFAGILFTPPQPDRKAIEKAWTPREKTRRLQQLTEQADSLRRLLAERERLLAEREAQTPATPDVAPAPANPETDATVRRLRARIAEIEAELAGVRKRLDREEKLHDINARRLQKINRVLSKMGITVADLFAGDAVMRLKSERIVQNVAAAQNWDSTKKRLAKLAAEGWDKASILKKLRISEDDARRAYEEIRRDVAARLSAFGSSALDAGNLETVVGPDDSATLGTPAEPNQGDEIDPEKAKKIEDMLSAMGLVGWEELDSPVRKARVEQAERRRAEARKQSAKTPRSPKPAPGETITPAPDKNAWADDPDALPPAIDPTNPADATRVVREVQAAEGSGWDMAHEYWINSILSGPLTQAANITGNTLNVAWTLGVKRGIEATVSDLFLRRATGNANLPHLAEYGRMLRAIIPALSRAWGNAVFAFSTEQSYFSRDILETPLALANDGFDDRDRRSVAIGGKTGRVIRVPVRLLGAVDDFTKTMTASLEAAAHAYRIAKSEGMSGEQMEKRIKGLVNEPGSAAWIAAYESAQRMAFQEEHGGDTFVGRVELGARVARRVPGIRYLVPFVKTPLNIFSQGIRQSPFGSLALLARYVGAMREKQRSGTAIGETFPVEEQLGRAIEQFIAFTIAGMLYGAAAGDDDDEDKQILITGALPEETSGLRSLAQRGGVTPYTLRVGDFQLRYNRIEPLATILGATVDMVTAAKRARNEGRSPALGALAAVTTSITAQAENKTMLAGVEAMMEAIKQTRQQQDIGAGAKDWAASFLSGWIPNILRQPVRLADPLVRQPNSTSFREQVAENIVPQLNQPMVDAFGRQVEKGGSALARITIPADIRSRPEMQRVDRLLTNWNQTRDDSADRWAPAPIPGRIKIEGNWRSMTDEERYRYATRAGEITSNILRAAALNVQKPSEEDIQRIKKAFTTARQIARREIFGATSAED